MKLFSGHSRDVQNISHFSGKGIPDQWVGIYILIEDTVLNRGRTVFIFIFFFILGYLPGMDAEC